MFCAPCIRWLVVAAVAGLSACASEGRVSPFHPLDCDDADPCTADHFDPEQWQCTHMPLAEGSCVGEGACEEAFGCRAGRCECLTRCETTAAPALVVLNGTLIDGTGAEPVPDAAVVILAGFVAQAGPRAAVQICPRDTLVDAAGGTLLPGFINAHVHQGNRAKNLERWAQLGVTTVRDLGSANKPKWQDWADAILAGGPATKPQPFADRDTVLDEPAYARVLLAGPVLTVAGRYPIPAWGDSMALTVDSAEDAARKTGLLLDAGANLIKFARMKDPSIPELSDDEVRAIVAAAHARGSRVTAHITNAADLALAVAAGFDDAAHVPVDAIDDAVLQQMVAQGTALVPTLAMWKFYFKDAPEADIALDNVRRFHAAGGLIALGDDYSDNGNGQVLGIPQRDIEFLLTAGLTPMQILLAGTRDAAKVCGRAEELGTLEPGKRADLIVVAGDPLQDLSVMQDGLQVVIKDGVVIRTPKKP